MKFNHMGILLLRACSASCKICCSESSPTCKEQLDFEKVKKYIRSTKEIPEIETIGLTGGEVFLEYEKLKELVALIKECNKITNVMTNCFWAKSYEIAYEKLFQLKQAGLESMGISFDYYHNQFIPEQNIKNVLRAARQLSIMIGVNAMKASQWPLGEVLDRLDEDCVDVNFYSFPCYPVGGAKKVIPEDEFIRAKASKNCHCLSGGVYSIHYDGTIYPCCSPNVTDTELTMGNYETNTASQTLKTLKSSRILYVLGKYGFDYFITIAKEELGIPVPDYVTSSCELCSLFFSKENINRFYPYVYETTEQLLKESRDKKKKEEVYGVQ